MCWPPIPCGGRAVACTAASPVDVTLPGGVHWVRLQARQGPAAPPLGGDPHRPPERKLLTTVYGTLCGPDLITVLPLAPVLLDGQDRVTHMRGGGDTGLIMRCMCVVVCGLGGTLRYNSAHSGPSPCHPLNQPLKTRPGVGVLSGLDGRVGVIWRMFTPPNPNCDPGPPCQVHLSHLTLTLAEGTISSLVTLPFLSTSISAKRFTWADSALL